jgi:hypothetical protein
VRVYHTTARGDAILTGGFRDAEGSYGLAATTLRGVWVADQPLGIGDGVDGDQVLGGGHPGG